MNMGRISYVAVTVATCALLLATATGCQPSAPKSVSLEEAKKATTSFAQDDLSVPPRKVDDILALLDNAERSGKARLAQLQAEAAAQPPASGGDRELARFYYDRSMAAKRLGLLKQHVADLEFAYRHADEAYGDKLLWSDNRNYLGTVAYAHRNFGDNARADELFARYYRIAKDPEMRIYAVGNLAQIRAKAGNIEEAERYLKEFESTYSRIDRKDAWARYYWHYVHGNYLVSIGRFDDADEHFKEQVKLIPEFGSQGEMDMWIPAEYATFLLRSGRTLDAELQARESLNAAIRYAGTPSASVSFPIITLADALAAQGRLDEAAILVKKALELFAASGAPAESQMIRNAERSLALLLAAEGDWSGSRAAFERLRQAGEFEATNTTWIDERIRVSSVYPMVMIETGALPEALTLLRNSHARMIERLGEKHATTAELGGVLAVALAKSGDPTAALELFRSTIPVLVSRSRETQKTGSAATASERALDYILANYLRLLADIRGTAIETASGLNALEESFQIADIARGRTVQQAINASAARAAASDQTLADLARREQDAHQQISALYAVVSGAQSEAAVTDLRTRIDTLRSARAALMEEIERRFPDYAALINPKPLGIAEAQSLLHPGEALVSIYVGQEESYVWAVSASSVEFARTPLGAAEIGRRVSDLRRALDPSATTLGDIPPFDVAAARELYNIVLAPVASAWQSAKTIVVVPHGALAQLPFALLPTEQAHVNEDAEPLFAGYRDVQWLARDHAVVTVPAASAFAALRRLPPATQTRTELAAFGDPIFASDDTAGESDQPNSDASLASRGLLAVRGLPVKLRSGPGTETAASAQLAMLPRLPETADEVRDIAVALSADPSSSVFLGPDASEQRVKTMTLADRRVLVFATHGLVPGDLDGLTQPALALSNPTLSKDGGDGLLTMGEILALKLNADWVVLSACNTAAGEGTGSEAISGLGRAFLYAGARSLLVSNWPVETTSTRRLTTEIFDLQAGDPGLSRAAAQQQSMLKLIDGPGYLDSAGTAVFSYAHPIFWAPFTLTGDGS